MLRSEGLVMSCTGGCLLYLRVRRDDLKRSKHVGVVLSVLSESYIGTFVG